MVRFYTRRRITGWYTDELGRRRPITTKFFVIELPEIARIVEMREKIREKWKNVEAVLGIRLTLRNMDLKLFMETFPKAKIVGTRKDELGTEYVIELYGIRFIANEYEIENNKILVLEIEGLMNGVGFFDVERLLNRLTEFMKHLLLYIPMKR